MHLVSLLLGAACALLLVDPLRGAEDLFRIAPSVDTGTEEGADRASEESEPREEASFEDPIETDRDSFTPATTTAGRGRLIVESAYSFIDNRHIPETHSFPELLLRYGVTKRIELRLGWNYEVGGGGDVSGAEGSQDVQGARLKREYRVTYGVKVAVTEQDRWLPQSVLILQGFTPTGGATNDTQIVATYAAGWKFANGWKLDAATRYGSSSEGGDRFSIWAPSIVLKVPLGERWSVHGEYFGLFSQDKAQDFSRHYFSPGIHYLVTPNLEVGVRVGWGLNEQASRFFSNVGFGLRF
jgi:outer membrane putative beta-barrel porin/alpha-amylase